MVYGGVDHAYVSKLVAKGAPGTGLVPIKTTDGRGIASFWLIDYPSSGIGPYDEVVVTVLVAPADKAAVPCSSTEAHCGPYALYLHDGVVSFSYKLWLDKEVPVAYGRELLGTDKYLAKSLKVDISADGSVDVSLPALAEVHLQRQSALSTLSVLPKLALTGGIFNTLRLLAATPILHLTLVTPIGVAEGFDDRAPFVPTVLINDPAATINPWDPAKDSIKLSGEFEALKFAPATVQQSKNFRFALLTPFN